MNIAIVDDCERDRSLLAQMIRQYGIMNQLDLGVEHFPCGEALLLNYQPFRYTVIFSGHFYGRHVRHRNGGEDPLHG